MLKLSSFTSSYWLPKRTAWRKAGLSCGLALLLGQVAGPVGATAAPPAGFTPRRVVAAKRQPLGTLGLRVPENPVGATDGLEYQYFQDGNIDQLPNFASLTPRQSGTVSSFDVLSMRQRDYAYALRFTGYLTVPTDGEYKFFVNSDDGAQLFIGSQLVVDNDGTHGVQEHLGTIGLQAGTHAFTVTYFQSGGPTALAVSYQPPGGTKQAIPAGNLHHGGTLITPTLQVYPSPAIGPLTVHYTTNQAQTATMMLADGLGRRVEQRTIQLQPGDNDIVFPTDWLATGSYLLWLRPTADKSQRIKVQIGH